LVLAAWLPGQSGRRILVESAELLASPLVDLGAPVRLIWPRGVGV
jgi:hypothetical protein